MAGIRIKGKGKVKPSGRKSAAEIKAAAKDAAKAAEQIRKATGKKAADLGTPASLVNDKGAGKLKASNKDLPSAGAAVKRVKGIQKTSEKNQLRVEYDGLKPNAKRAEQLKGSKSKYSSVINERKKLTPTKKYKFRDREAGKANLDAQLKEAGYKTGGKITRGIGKALRGHGKAKYSNKPY